MELPDIDPERMKAASDALDKVVQAGGTQKEAREAFERVLKGDAPAENADVVITVEVEPTPEKPAKTRKPRADKGQPRKKAPPKPEELAAAAPEAVINMTVQDDDAHALEIGKLVVQLVRRVTLGPKVMVVP